jgi:hypothetical protein
LYKCHVCGRQFVDKDEIDVNALWELYSSGKQTYFQLSKQFGCSPKTIQRRLDEFEVIKRKTFSHVANVIMDTTYFGRDFGVMVFKNSLDGNILFKQYVRYETNHQYLFGIQEITRRGIRIQSIICDGRRGLTGLFPEVPMQICHFHQVQIVLRYLTRKPQNEAAKALKKLTLGLTKVSKGKFINNLNDWHLEWSVYLNERSVSKTTGKSFYTHKRLRSAYLSLKRNLPFLFTFEDYKEYKIPNTTNALDGHFADLKNKLRNHNGLSMSRKMKFIDGFFKA